VQETAPTQLEPRSRCGPRPQPCNDSGFIDPAAAAKFGLLSFDWSNGRDVWARYPPAAAPCEEMLVEQAAMVKAISPSSRVFVYRNMELALQWLSSERAAMYDPAKAGYFLQYTDGAGHKNGTIYNEPTEVAPGVTMDQCVGGGGDGGGGDSAMVAAPIHAGVERRVPSETQRWPLSRLHARPDAPHSTTSAPASRRYFWDFRNASAVRYWIDTVVLGVGGVGAPGGVVDGVFTDDVQVRTGLAGRGPQQVLVLAPRRRWAMRRRRAHRPNTAVRADANSGKSSGSRYCSPRCAVV
jgi:hypothetical protein